jgi:hypothetical protein
MRIFVALLQTTTQFSFLELLLCQLLLLLLRYFRCRLLLDSTATFSQSILQILKGSLSIGVKAKHPALVYAQDDGMKMKTGS